LHVAVIGTGYLGATHAACLAELGHSVIGVDVDPGKVAKLRAGEVPFFEPDLEQIVRSNLSAGRLRFTNSFKEAADFADVHFLTVGTPQKEFDSCADLSFVETAVDALGAHLTRPALIAGKCTVPVGTADRLAKRVRSIAPAAADIEMAWNPEFLREGFAVKDTLRPDRIVVGVENRPGSQAESTLRRLYGPILEAGTPMLITNLPTAELVKVAANAFLATKISFINAVAEVCDAASADVTVLAKAIGYDKRIGPHFLNAGLGFGGGCLPKDLRAFAARARELGVGHSMTFLHEVDMINMRQRSRAVEMASELCGSLSGARVAILGGAFKPDTDDVRDSPALDVAHRIQEQGASVSVYDPKAIENARRVQPALDFSSSLLDACRGADVILVLTEWEEFKQMRPNQLASVTAGRRIVDGRNCLIPNLWREAGWTYRSFGRPSSD
jgi:UDPglucose 6-dehydrogenase